MSQPSSPITTVAASADLATEFRVVCFCAAWCGTCREYQPGFEALANQFPGVGFRWVDVEDDSSDTEDLDVENFPTLLIKRGSLVLFFGPMLPHLRILQQTLETFMKQSPTEAQGYAHATPERAAWQAQLAATF